MSAPVAILPVGRDDALDYSRVSIQHSANGRVASTIADDVREGLLQTPKRLSPKYFYDDRGSRLFEAICELPEYYLTRAEHALLRRAAAGIIERVDPTHLIELGSGASRKTRRLLDALTSKRPEATYMPWDVSETMLRQTAAALSLQYPRLNITGLVGDYERDLDAMPAGDRRLVIFLGSTIGNLTRAATERFLRALGAQLAEGDGLLLGLDLVKAPALLHAAYNDTAGVTAEFNLNVLRVLNRELNARFDPALFEHVAFYDEGSAQIEMHLRARTTHAVTIRDLGVTVPFIAGETIHTEISRKFTHADAVAMMVCAGCQIAGWYVGPDRRFALALGVRGRSNNGATRHP
jgi:L-histidine Nalpha-methyltransferase